MRGWRTWGRRGTRAGVELGLHVGMHRGAETKETKAQTQIPRGTDSQRHGPERHRQGPKGTGNTEIHRKKCTERGNRKTDIHGEAEMSLPRKREIRTNGERVAETQRDHTHTHTHKLGR